MPLCYITQENLSLIALEDQSGFLWQEECEYLLDVGEFYLGSHTHGFYEKNVLTWYPFIYRPEHEPGHLDQESLQLLRARAKRFAYAITDMNIQYCYDASEHRRGVTVSRIYLLSMTPGSISLLVEFSDASVKNISLGPIFIKHINEIHDYVNYEFQNNVIHCVITAKKYFNINNLWMLAISKSSRVLEVSPRCIHTISPKTSIFDRKVLILQPGTFFSIDVRDSYTGGIFQRITSQTKSLSTSTSANHIQQLQPDTRDPFEAESRLETPQTVDVIFSAHISNVEKLLQQKEDKPLSSFIKLEGIRSINGVKPDENGNINLYATGSIVLDMVYDLDHHKKKPSIRIRSFARPCISCADLDDILDRFIREITIYNTAARKVRAAQQKYIDTVFYIRKMLSDLSIAQQSGNPDLEDDFKNLLQQLL